MSKVLLNHEGEYPFRIQLEQEITSSQWRLAILFKCPNSGKAEGFTLNEESTKEIVRKMVEHYKL